MPYSETEGNEIQKKRKLRHKNKKQIHPRIKKRKIVEEILQYTPQEDSTRRRIKSNLEMR